MRIDLTHEDISKNLSTQISDLSYSLAVKEAENGKLREVVSKYQQAYGELPDDTGTDTALERPQQNPAQNS